MQLLPAPALLVERVVGRRREREVDVAAEGPVVLVLVEQPRQEFRCEGDQESLVEI